MHRDLILLFVELAQLQKIYSGSFMLFLDHGFGQLRVTIKYENTEKAISIRVERLSADLESSSETIHLDRSQLLPTLCSVFNIPHESLLHMGEMKTTSQSC